MLCRRIALCRPSVVERTTGGGSGVSVLLNFVRKTSILSAQNMKDVAEKREATADVDGGTKCEVPGIKKAKLDEQTDQLDQVSADITTAQTTSSCVESSGDIEKKLKPKKYAVCFMYCGKGYFGLQKNPGVKTIEEDLLKACLEVGLINEDDFNNPQSIMFQRAARTDKGVSAVRQIVSLKLPTLCGTPEEMKQRINSKLVDQIRVIALKRVTKNFNAKNNADARTYSYILPTLAFAPSQETADEKYRITSERIQMANDYLKIYLGCHNFHNFTSGRLATDASSHRYIKEIECSNPFLVGNFEYAQIRIRGQSFMLHQIRKMVGLVIAIMRGHTTEAIIKRAWGPEKLDLPRAPALGLMLEQVHYDRYNTRYGGDGVHEELTWEEYQDEIHAFKQKHIYPNIWTTEENEDSMVSWMSYLSLHSYDVRAHEIRPALLEESHEEEFGDAAEDAGETQNEETL